MIKSSPSERKDFCSVVFKLNSTSSNPGVPEHSVVLAGIALTNSY
jgi:hypothetical protein